MSISSLTKVLFTPTVPVLSIRGNINKILVNQIVKQLNNVSKSTAKSLAIVVDSQGGCPYETSRLAYKIKHFAEENHLHINTFATQVATGSGYQLLSLGDTVYAQDASVIGKSGCVTTLLRMKQYFENHDIRAIKVTTNEQLQSHYQDVFGKSTDEVKSLINGQLNYSSRLVFEEIQKNRKDKLKVPFEQLSEQIYLGYAAKEAGIIDQIGTYEQVLMKLYPEAKLVFYSPESKLQKLEENFYFLLKLTQSTGFYILMGILFVKFLIKWTLIIMMWRSVKKSEKKTK